MPWLAPHVFICIKWSWLGCFLLCSGVLLTSSISPDTYSYWDAAVFEALLVKPVCCQWMAKNRGCSGT